MTGSDKEYYALLEQLGKTIPAATVDLYAIVEAAIKNGYFISEDGDTPAIAGVSLTVAHGVVLLLEDYLKFKSVDSSNLSEQSRLLARNALDLTFDKSTINILREELANGSPDLCGGSPEASEDTTGGTDGAFEVDTDSLLEEFRDLTTEGRSTRRNNPESQS